MVFVETTQKWASCGGMECTRGGEAAILKRVVRVTLIRTTLRESDNSERQKLAKFAFNVTIIQGD